MSEKICSVIVFVRGCKVILDNDLANLYGVTTKRLNEQVRRNIERFPVDFMFQLEYQELMGLRSQIATSKKGGRRYLPYAFTEYGVIMAANVLNSKIAIDASILIVRAFTKIRNLLLEHADLKKRLDEIEVKIAKGFSVHDQELQEIRFIISQLEEPFKKNQSKRKLGF